LKIAPGFRETASGVKLIQFDVRQSAFLLHPLIQMNRREKIEAMLADDPGDTFLRYSMAMELRSEGEYEKSLAQLDELTGDDPPCVPAFLMAAQQLVDLDRIDEAREQLRNGIEQARVQGETHAAAEMSELLSSLGELGEL
jgi:thioredoxin-like negative regulator of GroEL